MNNGIECTSAAAMKRRRRNSRRAILLLSLALTTMACFASGSLLIVALACNAVLFAAYLILWIIDIRK
ncbi:MAG: hypothetical protein AB7S53_11395 [Thiomonas sp.]|jgi:hypothetical protein